MKDNHDSNVPPSEGFDAALDRCQPEDFDGHTEFHRLTPEQRLEWLAEAATFVYENRGRAQERKGKGKIPKEKVAVRGQNSEAKTR